MFTRRDELRAAKSIQEKAFANPKINFLWDSVIEELHGDEILSGMTVKNVKTGETQRIDADEEDGLFGVFGFIGYNPRTELLLTNWKLKMVISKQMTTCVQIFLEYLQQVMSE